MVLDLKGHGFSRADISSNNGLQLLRVRFREHDPANGMLSILALMAIMAILAITYMRSNSPHPSNH
jgi:hypothetical protein